MRARRNAASSQRRSASGGCREHLPAAPFSTFSPWPAGFPTAALLRRAAPRPAEQSLNDIVDNHSARGFTNLEFGLPLMRLRLTVSGGSAIDSMAGTVGRPATPRPLRGLNWLMERLEGGGFRRRRTSRTAGWDNLRTVAAELHSHPWHRLLHRQRTDDTRPRAERDGAVIGRKDICCGLVPFMEPRSGELVPAQIQPANVR